MVSQHELYDIIKLHQSVKYGPKGTLAASGQSEA
jgi:hypothetical protein